ncbi:MULTISPECIES: DUF4238 domain-containing protein [Bacillus]|uniref:DUF4238 domain-containing protein n=1 Tax=Bacillus TaxID=1386 RepID=UPI0015F8F80D|nr:DUF4238 domain-containing protein [Bacillus sonorensis]
MRKGRVMQKNPVRQHTIPKTYLKHFSKDQKTIYLYDKEKYEVREQSIASVSIVKDIYTVVDKENEQKLYDLEHLLADEIEPVYNPTLSFVEENKYVVDKRQLAYFIAAQYLRSPRVKKQILKEIQNAIITGESGEIFNERDLRIFKSEIIQDNRKKINFKEFVKKREEGFSIDTEIDDSCYGQYFVNTISGMSESIAKQNWAFIKPPMKRNFLTSDNPYISVKDFEDSIGWLKGDIFILSKSLALVIGDLEGWYDLDLKDVKMINVHTVKNSDRFVFSHSKDLLNRFIK